MDLVADLEFATHLADVAAEVTMRAFGGRQQVRLKQDRSPVTDADRAAEQAIRAAVREHRPGDGVLGEEEGLASGDSGRVWVVDPIDGTAMFAEGIPLWTTLIALREPDGSYSVGVADAPAVGERAVATRGGGAWLNGRRLSVSAASALSDAYVMHASVSEFAAIGELDQLLRLTSAARASRTLVDAWGQLLVARGSADVLIEAMACHEWDWAATSVIVEEAGGHVLQSDGSAPTPGCRLLVTNGRLDAEVVAVLRGSI